MDDGVDGGQDFRLLAILLKDLGDKGLRQELYRGIQRTTKPLRTEMLDALLEGLPKRGGLNAIMKRDTKIGARTSSGKDFAGVRLKASGKHDNRMVEQGRLRHPVFGNRKVWVQQPLQPYLLRRTFDGGSTEVRTELMKLLEDIARKIAAKVD